MSSYASRIGTLRVIRAFTGATPKLGVSIPLPASLKDGMHVRLEGWQTLSGITGKDEHNHTVVWTVQPVDDSGSPKGKPVAQVWERHFRLIQAPKAERAPKTQAAPAPGTGKRQAKKAAKMAASQAKRARPTKAPTVKPAPVEQVAAPATEAVTA